MTQLQLGGSRFVSADIVGDPATVLVPDWVDVIFPTWDQLPVGTEIDWIVTCQVPTGASVVAQLNNVDNAEITSDPTPFTDDTQMVTHTIPLLAGTHPNLGDKARLQLVVTGGDGLPGLFAVGELRFILP